ncbi:MAG: GGDEF domain-containing protein [Candidatus Aminicenantales bacterium]
MNPRLPVVTRSLRTRLWSIIILAIGYLVYSSLADFIPQYWDAIGILPLSRSILTLGMVIILLICLSGLGISEKMNSMIIREGLTGLFNRAYIRQRLEQELYRAKRYSHDLSLLMIDLDNFKKLNDRYGHAAGDHLLRYFSQLLIETIRPSDIAARYGGEEFLVILPETNKEEAWGLAERLRQKISLYPFRVDSRKEDLLFTISIGMASYPEFSQSSDELMAQADEALYLAKKNGKNKVAVYAAN